MENINLYNKKAKTKIKELAEGIDFTMMATDLEEKPFHAVPMSTKKVDEHGDIWFLSGKDSEHNANILKDKKVVLIYSKPSEMNFLKIYGDAYIRTNEPIFEELYKKSDDMWFKGIKDPNLSAIQIKPLEAYYWEAKNNTFITLFKMGLGFITGDQPEVSNSGKLDL